MCFTCQDHVIWGYCCGFPKCPWEFYSFHLLSGSGNHLVPSHHGTILTFCTLSLGCLSETELHSAEREKQRAAEGVARGGHRLGPLEWLPWAPPQLTPLGQSAVTQLRTQQQARRHSPGRQQPQALGPSSCVSFALVLAESEARTLRQRSWKLKGRSSPFTTVTGAWRLPWEGLISTYRAHACRALWLLGMDICPAYGSFPRD